MIRTKTSSAAPRKKTTVRRHQPSAEGTPAPLKPAVTCDYPQPGQAISSAEYTLRFSTSFETPSVEVSIDGGAWQPCREAVGHWWFDWSGYAGGEHALAYRAQLPGGGFTPAATARVWVSFEQSTLIPA